MVVAVAPTGLTVTSESVTSVRLSWTLSSTSGVTRYQVAIAAAGGTPATYVDIDDSNANTDEYVYPGLLPGTTYTFKVRAFVDENGLGSATASGATESWETPVITFVRVLGEGIRVDVGSRQAGVTHFQESCRESTATTWGSWGTIPDTTGDVTILDIPVRANYKSIDARVRPRAGTRSGPESNTITATPHNLPAFSEESG